MSDTGWRSPGSVAEQASGGSSWTNLANVVVEDGSWAYTLRISPGNANILDMSILGFAVPSNANILGVEVGIKHQKGSYWQLQNVQLIHGGSVIGAGKTDTSLPTTLTWDTYGDRSDVWGASLTPAIVNDASFGAEILYYFPTTTAFAYGMYVDALRMRVYYDVPEPPRRLAGGIVVGPAAPLRPLVQERHAQILRRQ